MRKNQEVNVLFQSVKTLIEDSRKNVVRNVNVIMVYTYFNIGRLIIEKEQKGQSRAAYAKETLKNLSTGLSMEFSQGYSVDNRQSSACFAWNMQNPKHCLGFG